MRSHGHLRRHLVHGVIALLLVALGIVGPGQAPAAFSTATPTGLVADDSPVPMLSWDRVDGARQYRVQGYTSAERTGTPLFNVTTTNTTYVPTSVLTGTLFWGVEAFDGVEWSAPAHGQVVVAQLSRPTNLTISAGERILPPVTPPVISWDPVPGASAYDVEVDHEGDEVGGALETVTSTSFVWDKPQEAGDYWVRVRARYNGGGLQSEWTDYVPYDVAQLAPATSKQCSTGLICAPDPLEGVRPSVDVEDVVFDWDPVPGAKEYQVWVAQDEDFNTPVSPPVTVRGTRYSPTQTLKNRSYYWKVRPLNATGLGTWPATASTFQRHWPDAPVPVYPVSGVSPVSGDLYFQWTPVDHATRYELILGRDSNFTPGTFYSCIVAGTTFTLGYRSDGCTPGGPARVTQGEAWYWKVRAIDAPAEQDGIYSPVSMFYYDSGAVTKLAPLDGSTTSVPSLRWKATPQASRYEVALRDKDGRLVEQRTTYALSWTPTKALTPDASPYSWTVVSIDSDGRRSPVYPAWTFTYERPAASPLPLHLKGPEYGDTRSRFPSLAWEPMEGAAYYKVRIVDNGYALSEDTTEVLRTQLAHPAVTDWGTHFLKPGTWTWYVDAFNSSGTKIGTTPQTGHGTFTLTKFGEVTGQRVALDGRAIDSGTACTRVLANPDPAQRICGPIPATPVLDWTPVPGAGGYMIYLFDDTNLTTPVYDPLIIATESSRWTPPGSVKQALAENSADGAYRWFVRPCVAIRPVFVNCGPDPESLIGSATHAFRKVSPAVELQGPGDGATVSDEITFTWEDYLATNERFRYADGTTPSYQTAMRYRLQVAASPTITDSNVIDDVTVDQTSYTAFADLYPEGDLWWRVQAIDAANNRLSWSSVRKVVKATAAANLNPAVPAEFETPQVDPDVFPGPEEHVDGGMFPFRWAAGHFDVSWDLEVYARDDTTLSSANRVFAIKTKQAAYVPSKSLSPSTDAYRWRVRRTDVSGNPGRWSDLGRFFVDPSTPNLVSPAEGVSVAPDELVLDWSPLTGHTQASKYTIRLQRLGSTSVTTVTTAATAWAPTSSLSSGTYTWTVTASDVSGVDIGRSSGSFVVDSQLVAVTPSHLDAPDGAAVGRTLTATAPAWNREGVTTTYQWLRNGSLIWGATGTEYALTPSDYDKSISVRATGKRAGYVDGSSVSNSVTVSAGDALFYTAAPAVSGTPAVGSSLSSTPGSWSDPEARFAYQWLRNGAVIPYATSSTYRVGTEDAGRQISLQVTATRPGYASGSATSSPMQINKVASSTSIRLSSTRISRRARATVYANVSAVGFSAPTGTVKVFDGRKLLRRLSLSSTSYGRVSYRLPRLSAGRHTIKVAYGGSRALRLSSARALLRVTRR